ncbi:filamentous hemagglutinin N-terminal domain-containing protein [Robbsia sp. Bb-Pol-6]|uniref:Filamentous hemagglutinin N-terminal domain-containing protein n=1 Tax=Robbsia betulipollinis TaxID=2981849 RepID=A0ABT3ZJ44_9BURK|nr:filamentous hemagglutinin N-terminal domain-containing protein [Robbsia betulipollinis]MCY0385985.1 filamentous hemagglutinin N-terminal domain-containing protein [Robbsia betulipollinis]
MPSRLSSWSLSRPSPPLAMVAMPRVASHARRAWRGRCARMLPHAWLLWGLLISGTAQALAPDAVPLGPRLRQGDAAVARDAFGLHIVQMGDHVIIDWQSFDIGRRAAVHVMQTSSEATLLNRVTGATASEIAGNLTASGRVFLINPNGIGFASSGTVDAAAFVASTLDIADRDFMAGAFRFDAAAAPAAGVIVQEGEITIDPGGFAVLLGRRIEHSGVIRTPLGQTGLAAGDGAALTPGSAEFLRVTRPAAVSEPGLAAIHASGIIEARGGLALLSAPARGAETSVNLSGSVLSGWVASRAGRIVIDGDRGVVRVAGVLDASSGVAGDGREPGGTVDIVARRVVMDAPTIDVRGTRGGGRVRLAVDAMEGADTVRCFPHTRLRFVGNGAGRAAPLSPVLPAAAMLPASSSSPSVSPSPAPGSSRPAPAT